MTKRSFWVLRGVGGTFLAFLGACAGRYDVGDGNDSGGNAGQAAADSGGSTSGGSGGSGSSTGGRSNGAGGSGTDTGGTDAGGSDASGGTSAGSAGTAGTGVDTGGTSAGGSDASGGTSLGGSAGASSNARCGVEPSELTYGTLATPEIVWKRLSLLLADEQASAFPELLPEESSPEWAAGAVSDWLEEARDGEPLPGLVRFTSAWLGAGASGDTADIVEGTAEALGAGDASFLSVVVPSDGPGLFEDASLNRLRGGLSARGAALQRSLLCVETGFPPADSTNVPPPAPGITRRQWLEETTSGAACRGCHSVIDPTGASLEGFDPLTGEPRTVDEQGLQIDSSGTFTTYEAGQTYAFTSIQDLMPALAPSCEVARCFVQQVASDAATSIGSEPLSNAELAYVLYAYADADYSIEALYRALAQTPTFLE